LQGIDSAGPGHVTLEVTLPDDAKFGAEVPGSMTVYALLEDGKVYKQTMPERRVRLAANPFGKGAMRGAYYLKDVKTDEIFVAKRMLDTKDTSEASYEADILTQIYARFLAYRFNKQRAVQKMLDFAPGCIIRIGSMRTMYFMEPLLRGEFVKYGSHVVGAGNRHYWGVDHVSHTTCMQVFN